MRSARRWVPGSSERAALVGVLSSVALAACGEDAPAAPRPAVEPPPTSVSRDEHLPASEPRSVSAAAGPSAERTEEPAPGETPPSAGTTGALQLVGADRTHLLFLDTGTTPLEVRSVDVGALAEAGRPLAAVAFLGCGRWGAVRTRTEYAVYDRGGTRVSVAPLPDLLDALGARLDPEYARLVEMYGGEPERRDAVGRGPLVRLEDGSLALEGELLLAEFNGEMEGCLETPESLRVGLALPAELEGTACEAAARHPVDVWSPAPLPAGWRCARHATSAADTAPPEWLGVGWDVALAAVHVDLEACDDDVPEDPWERVAVCTGATELLACRRDGDPSLFVTTIPEETMGCAAHPEVTVLRGGRVVARTGGGARIVEVEGGLLAYGGRTQWYVTALGELPVRFGIVPPDVVRAR